MDFVGLIVLLLSIKFTFIVVRFLRTEMKVRGMKRKYNEKGQD